MKKTELLKLLELYKKALSEQATVSEFKSSIQEARIQLDKSFVLTGENDKDLEEYISELIELQELYTNKSIVE
jgi:hypothetical protein